MALNQSSFCSSLIDRMQNSHLSSKISLPRVGCMKKWWAQRDLNPRPNDYESSALTTELWALLVFERAQCALRKALGQRKIKSLISEGYDASYTDINPKGLHRVAYGRFKSKNKAIELLYKLRYTSNKEV